jgi:hypothetical protein
MENKYNPSWSAILIEAVEKPGLIHRAYQSFHNYSLGNQLLAMIQCAERQLTPGPINTYPAWQKLNRQVRKGEKALTLCMPVTGKRRSKERDPPVEEQTEEARREAPETEAAYTRFVYRPNWFVLAQTDGAPYELPPLDGWDKNRALEILDVKEVPFEWPDGNTQGYAVAKTIAINPVAALPHKTLFHELGHIELGHTRDNTFKEDATPRHLREAEAESVALLCLDTLQLDGAVYSRGYIQNWLAGNKIPDNSAQRVFGAADRILKAGREALSRGSEQDAR